MMRHVPMAEFKDKLADTIAAAEAGDDIVITRHGRDVIRLVPVRADDIESRRRAFAEMAALRESLRARGVSVTRHEVKEWIAEGRP